MEKLELYIPTLDELRFCQKMMSDPETMSYNAKTSGIEDGVQQVVLTREEYMDQSGISGG